MRLHICCSSETCLSTFLEWLCIAEGDWKVIYLHAGFILLWTWSKDHFALHLRVVAADEPRLPQWERNYGVPIFLTSSVWVMSWNLNNLSFRYLEKTVLCSHLIWQFFHVSTEEKATADCKRPRVATHCLISLVENIPGIFELIWDMQK